MKLRWFIHYEDTMLQYFVDDLAEVPDTHNGYPDVIYEDNGNGAWITVPTVAWWELKDEE